MYEQKIVKITALTIQGRNPGKFLFVLFDLFAVKSKKANKTNSSIRFLGESMARQSAFEINWPLGMTS